MTWFDLAVILFAIGAAVGGYRLGFLTRVISWLGLALGIAVAVNLLPPLVRRVEDGSQMTLVLLAVAVLLGCALVGQGIGLAIGSRLHIALPQGNARKADRIGGGVLGVIGVLIVLWLLIPSLGSVSGNLSDQLRRSVIAQEVHQYFPDPPGGVEDLRRLVGDSFPEVFEGMQSAPDVGPPPAEAVLSEEARNAAVQSTVKVQGVACQRIQEGSGWVYAEDLVVTNAHVVAGEDETEVELPNGDERAAEVRAYDPQRDLAILYVEGLGLPPLSMRNAAAGDTGEVFGHTGGGPLQFSPFSVAESRAATGHDIYDQQTSTRQVLILSSDLAPGDSGGALIDAEGQVIGTAFAIAPDKPNEVAYALDNSELLTMLNSSDLNSLADTGGCLV